MDGEIDNVDLSSPKLFTDETINSVIEYARTDSPRSHMIQLQHYPTTFAIFEMEINGTYTLHVRRENILVEKPSTPDDIINFGYSWYIEDDKYDPMNRMSIQDYTLMHNNVLDKLNHAYRNIFSKDVSYFNIYYKEYNFPSSGGSIAVLLFDK